MYTYSLEVGSSVVVHTIDEEQEEEKGLECAFILKLENFITYHKVRKWTCQLQTLTNCKKSSDCLCIFTKAFFSNSRMMMGEHLYAVRVKYFGTNSKHMKA